MSASDNRQSSVAALRPWTLGEIVEQQALVSGVVGDAGVQVRGVQHDSRQVQPGDLFFALGGQVFDGADYSADAVARGAVAVAAETVPGGGLTVPWLQVTDGLGSLAAVARQVYGDPTSHLPVVGITGTNGKTTVAHLVAQALQGLGAEPGLAGTVVVSGPAGERAPTHTTPMADELMRIARWLLESQATHFVTEVSSHGLAMRRVDGVRFEVAAFTNLSQDHLDFHGDMARYGAAKARLFTDLAPRVAVLNWDQPLGQQLSGQTQGDRLRYSASGADVELSAVQVRHSRSGIEALVRVPGGQVTLRSSLIGNYNLENLLCALGICIGLGFDAASAAAALAGAVGAPGRLQRVAYPDGPAVFVDYAHTPDALDRVCDLLRGLTPAQGRLIVVFGCGGDRDRAKRPLMGAAVARHAEIAVLTNDNPRGEVPEQIIADIVPGAQQAGMTEQILPTLAAGGKGLLVEPDRAAAIHGALQLAQPADIVLIAGKGHETYQLIGPQRVPFDDVQVAAASIAVLREAQ